MAVCLRKCLSCTTTSPALSSGPRDPCLQSLQLLSPTFKYLKSQARIKNEEKENRSAFIMNAPQTLLIYFKANDKSESELTRFTTSPESGTYLHLMVI